VFIDFFIVSAKLQGLINPNVDFFILIPNEQTVISGLRMIQLLLLFAMTVKNRRY